MALVASLDIQAWLVLMEVHHLIGIRRQVRAFLNHLGRSLRSLPCQSVHPANRASHNSLLKVPKVRKLLPLDLPSVKRRNRMFSQRRLRQTRRNLQRRKLRPNLRASLPRQLLQPHLNKPHHLRKNRSQMLLPHTLLKHKHWRRQLNHLVLLRAHPQDPRAAELFPQYLSPAQVPRPPFPQPQPLSQLQHPPNPAKLPQMQRYNTRMQHKLQPLLLLPQWPN